MQQSEIEAVKKYNYRHIALEGSCFMVGLSFIDVNAVVPVFINAFTGSLQLAGLALTLRHFMQIGGQLIFSPFTHKVKNIPRYMGIMAGIHRWLMLLMVPVLLLGTPGPVAVAIFLVLFALIFFMDGFLVSPWFDLVSRAVDPRMRGQMMCNQLLVGGAINVGTGFLIKLILQSTDLSDPQRYAILFGASALVCLGSVFLLARYKDLPRKVQSNVPAGYRESLRRIPGIVKRNKQCLPAIVARQLLSASMIALPQLVLFGERTFAFDSAQVSTLVYIQIIGSLMGGLVLGRISTRVGSRAVVATTFLIGMAVAALPFLAKLFSGAAYPFMMACTFLGGILLYSYIGGSNYLMDVLTERDRPHVLFLNALMIIPVTLCPFLGGMIAEKISFDVLFAVALAISLAGFLVSCTLLLSPKGAAKHMSALEAAEEEQALGELAGGKAS